MFYVDADLRRRIILQALLLGALCSCLSSGQQPPPGAPTQAEPEISSHEAPITFSSRVNLISVPVVVRDQEGRAVGNLEKQDFQVFDKGKPQTITKFSIEKSDRLVSSRRRDRNAPRMKSPARAAQAVLPEHYVAYLVDDVHLDRGDLLNTRQAMHRHLDEVARSRQPRGDRHHQRPGALRLHRRPREAARRGEQNPALYQRHRSAAGLSVYQPLHGRFVGEPGTVFGWPFVPGPAARFEVISQRHRSGADRRLWRSAGVRRVSRVRQSTN